MRITGGIPVGGNLGYAGGFNDLVYRGNPGQMMPMPYQGGGLSAELLAQGIPVGQDPRFPMDPKVFESFVDEQRMKNKFKNPGDLMRYVDQYNQKYYPGGLSEVPVGFDNKSIS